MCTAGELAGVPSRKSLFGDGVQFASAAPVPLVPDDEERFRQGLELLIAEKALYEARYELNNRPDWLDIPLNALRALSSEERG